MTKIVNEYLDIVRRKRRADAQKFEERAQAIRAKLGRPRVSSERLDQRERT